MRIKFNTFCSTCTTHSETYIITRFRIYNYIANIIHPSAVKTLILISIIYLRNIQILIDRGLYVYSLKLVIIKLKIVQQCKCCNFLKNVVLFDFS